MWLISVSRLTDTAWPEGPPLNYNVDLLGVTGRTLHYTVRLFSMTQNPQGKNKDTIIWQKISKHKGQRSDSIKFNLRLNSTYPLKLCHFKAQLGKNPLPKLIHMAVSRIRFSVDYWTEGHSSSLAVGQSSLNSGHMVFSEMAVYFSKWTNWKGKEKKVSVRERESTSKVELKVFCNLIMKVICHHFLLHSLP